MLAWYGDSRAADEKRVLRFVGSRPEEPLNLDMGALLEPKFWLKNCDARIDSDIANGSERA